MTKTDRRIVKTKIQIKQAFLSLLSEKSFELITIKDITGRADINRGTFYLHYVDKYNLLEQYENEIFEKMNIIIDIATNTKLTVNLLKEERMPIITEILQLMKDEAPFLKLILGPNGDPLFQEKMRQIFVQTIEQYIFNELDESQFKFPFELIITYISNAHLGVLTYWLQHDMQQSPEEIANMFMEIMLKGPFEASGLSLMLKEENSKLS